MRIVVADDRADLDRRGADWIEQRADPGTLLMLAAGRSVEGVYSELAARHDSLRGVSGVTLDELHPLPRDDPRNFGTSIDAALRSTGLALQPFDSSASDPDMEAQRIEQLVRAAGSTACVLGLGPTGHLAFNEPGESVTLPSRSLTLRRSTVGHLGGRAAIAPATGAMTLGLLVLLAADHLLLVVAGGKQRAFARAVVGRMGSNAPASLLRLHPSATVLCTDAELSEIPQTYLDVVGIGRPSS